MKFKLVAVEVELTRRQRMAAIAAVALVVVGTAGVAFAGPLVTFNPGDPLKAADLNNNFDGLDARIGTLETTAPTSLEATSNTPESSSAVSADLVYQSASLNLTPGTWLVEGSASVFTTYAADAVQVGLWDDTSSAEVPNSRGPVQVTAPVGGASCNGPYSNCTSVAAHSSALITISSNTTVKIKAFRNGTSRVWIGPAGPAVVLPAGTRIRAIRLH